MTAVRSSALPRITLCPAAAQPPAEPINWTNPYSRLGTAAHKAFEAVSNNIVIDIEEIADEHGVDANDLRRSFGFVMKAWHHVKEWFPDPIIERSLVLVGDVTLSGTPDFVSLVSPDELRVGDYKTGFLDHDCEAQLRGYCLLAMKHYNRKQAHAMVLRTRLRSGEGWRWTLDELESWWSDLSARIKADVPPTPGLHCSNCPRWGECPAGRRYLRQAAESLIATAEAGDHLGPSLSPSAMVELAAERKMVEDACRVVQTMLKLEVASRGGRVVHRDGQRSLELTEVVMREIDFHRGEPILRQELGVEFPECVKVLKTEMEMIVKGNAPRGQKGHAIQGLMERLDAAGAVHCVPVLKLEQKRVKD